MLAICNTIPSITCYLKCNRLTKRLHSQGTEYVNAAATETWWCYVNPIGSQVDEKQHELALDINLDNYISNQLSIWIVHPLR